MENTEKKYPGSPVSFGKDEIIIREGDKGKNAYLVQSGRVRVYRTDPEEGIIEIAILGPGQIFGEMSLIGHYKHMATVEAVESTSLIPISAETMDAKLARTDPLIRTILHAVIDRLYNETFLRKW